MRIVINIRANNYENRTIIELEEEKWDFLYDNYNPNYQNCEDIMAEITTKIKNNIKDLPEDWFIECMDLAD